MRKLNEKTKNILLYVSCFLIMAGSVAAVILVYSYDDKKTADETTTDSIYIDTSHLTLAMSGDLSDQINSLTTETIVVQDSSTWPPKQAELTLDLIYQNPELPAGCESVALTMLLNYYGFDLDKTTIADDYLIYSSDGSFVEGYSGNPYTSTGGGIYSPGMTDTANNFLIANDSDLRAVNISGTGFDNLLSFVANGTPVLVWTTIGFSTPNPAGTVYTYDGIDYQWVSQEHCVVLSGYDLNSNEITVYDPIYGITTCDKDKFAEIYNGMWRMSMILE
jgi:uncharacterized protein YvpB